MVGIFISWIVGAIEKFRQSVHQCQLLACLVLNQLVDQYLARLAEDSPLLQHVDVKTVCRRPSVDHAGSKTGRSWKPKNE